MPIEKFTVSRDESIYEAWPDVILTESGKLICVFSECEHHLNRDNARIVMTESRDRGRTWSKKRPLTGKGTKSDFFNCARISKLRDGRLAIVCDKVRKNENSGSEIYVWFADAEGTDWGEPVIYPFCGIVPDRLQQLESGRLILPAHFMNHQNGKLEQYLWYSDDNGRTWSDRVTVAADNRYNLCEASVIECEPGVLAAFLRENSCAGHPIFKTISRDNGETWSELYATPMDGGHRPTAGFLLDGRIMVTYRYLPSGTQNVFAAFMSKRSAMCTERKHGIRIMPLDYDRNPIPDLGYTGWAQFGDGEIYVVNYIKDDAQKAYIRGYSFRPEDVMLPEKEGSDEKPVF